MPTTRRHVRTPRGKLRANKMLSRPYKTVPYCNDTKGDTP